MHEAGTGILSYSVVIKLAYYYLTAILVWLVLIVMQSDFFAAAGGIQFWTLIYLKCFYLRVILSR